MILTVFSPVLLLHIDSEDRVTVLFGINPFQLNLSRGVQKKIIFKALGLVPLCSHSHLHSDFVAAAELFCISYFYLQKLSI